ncbi:MAG TPA: hypothetical protein VGR67_01820 [Candidatus Polarisedimenticolia bacterium]|jgi:hypothetical protein|nr:hypothetical protein [Candidatus Polarisedimenticolia bacterium]
MEKKLIAGAVVFVLVAGTYEEALDVKAVLRGHVASAEQPHTHTETPDYPAWLYGDGTVVGSTATASGISGSLR